MATEFGEPWSLGSIGQHGRRVVDKDGNILFACHDEALAHRIVACINACSGIRTKPIEAVAEGRAIVPLGAWHRWGLRVDEVQSPDDRPLPSAVQILPDKMGRKGEGQP